MDILKNFVYLYLIVLLICIDIVIGLDVRVETHIDGEDGSTTTLPCNYENADPGDNQFTLSWRTQGDVQVYEYDPRPSVNKDNAYGKYIGRYTRDNFNLVVADVEQSDDDTLCCHIGAYPTGQQASACTKFFTYKLSLYTKANNTQCSSTIPLLFNESFPLDVGYNNTYPAFDLKLTEVGGALSVTKDASMATQENNRYSLEIQENQDVTNKDCVLYRVEASTTLSTVQDSKSCLICEDKNFTVTVNGTNSTVLQNGDNGPIEAYDGKCTVYAEYKQHPARLLICINDNGNVYCEEPEFVNPKYDCNVTRVVMAESQVVEIYQNYTYPDGSIEERNRRWFTCVPDKTTTTTTGKTTTTTTGKTTTTTTDSSTRTSLETPTTDGGGCCPGGKIHYCCIITIVLAVLLLITVIIILIMVFKNKDKKCECCKQKMKDAHKKENKSKTQAI